MQKIDFEKRELIKKYTTQSNSKTLIKKSVTQKIQSAFRFNLQQTCSLERIFLNSRKFRFRPPLYFRADKRRKPLWGHGRKAGFIDSYFGVNYKQKHL